ncbi:COP9 signalosome complex subunit 4 [Raphidocelis subcapitata]|uniref:COP9 signalosome complex subunit 4 n=1 Tax=Raphidocelis subcapitata TaxID=307507 RepID=A0A2V0PK14_9CHLO|nr:COP9 signalosome complex subunit 4 [Raphidocelis subcapitata]|eukprot:GBF98333.1 COP9 signalosome complex subunit 4 [Raphidocelis subcapitata]
MSDIEAQLAAIAEKPDQKQKLELYRQLLAALLAAPAVETCNAFVDHMLSDEVQLVISRQVLQAFALEVGKLPADIHKSVARHALERLAPRQVSFEEQATVLRENLAAVLEGEEEWAQAAQTLAGIDLDSGVRNVDPAYRLRQNVRIAMLYLEDDDPVSAEAFIKKASSLMGAAKDEVLELQYKTCYARIMDSKRRFLEAASRYYELSSLSGRTIGGLTMGEDEVELALRSAIICTALAAAGPQRSRMLATLYKDERSSRLDVFPFLEKVYLERILRRDEVEAFSATLKPHQRALLPDNSTVLERAVMQHNLLAASKLYNNIYVEELGALLGVTPERAEQVAADMLQEGRLQGSIDQVASLIHFADSEEPLVQWDAQIKALCGRVNDIVEAFTEHAEAAGGRAG